MRKVFLMVMATIISASSSANFIVKYRSGKVVKTSADPRVTGIKALSIDTQDGSDEVEYVEENTILHTTSVPNDSKVGSQWGLFYNGNSFFDAHDIVRAEGQGQVVVAVLDTGIINHSDISNNIVGGYDFISNSSTARDGGARDSNPSDPGDKCGSDESTWHGTHVAGIIASQLNNSKGIAGAGINIKVSPVRVLGSCGGEMADIADAIRWAAGGSVAGVPTNPNPAKVINMSLGGQAYCARYMQSAIDYANSRGAVVVVSAGNSGRNIDDLSFTPANCRGVFRVGSFAQGGYHSNFSNYGNIVDIAAPGSNILSLHDMGTDGPVGETYETMSGTSMAAGFVSALAAMIYSVNPNLTQHQVKDLIKRNASGYWCPYSGCNNDAVDAYQAVVDATTESYDPHFRYDDKVLTPGFSPLSSNLNATESGGGACGTIDTDNNPGGGNTFLFLSLIVIAFHISRKRLSTVFK